MGTGTLWRTRNNDDIKLYRVTKGQFCGGFVCANGQVISSAPFLRRYVAGLPEDKALANVTKNYRGCRIEQIK